MRKKDCVFIGFRATKEERDLVDALMEATGLSVSDLLRGLIMNAKVIPAQFKTEIHVSDNEPTE